MRFPPIRFTTSCDRLCRISARRRPKDSPSGALGAITAQSGCQTAVAATLSFMGGFSAARRRLRERLCDGADRSTPSQNQIDVRARFRAANEMGPVAVEVERPRARHRPDDALRQAVRHSRERGLSGMRHPSRVGRPARQQARQVDSPHRRAARTACLSLFPRI